MAKSKEESIRGKLRGDLSKKKPFNIINECRKSISISDYGLHVRAFKRVAHLDSKKLLRLGPKELDQLLWNYPPLDPIPLKNELAWALAWLKGESSKINAYCCLKNELQELILADKMDVAAAILDDFCVQNGWSLWAVELRLALEQQTNGTEAQKSLAAKWKSTAPNRIISLIIQIVSDRNDLTFSHDAFYWNCQNSFPRFTSVDWLPTYLMYRSLSLLNNIESLSIILSRELTSSLIDYYEAVIEAMFYIADETAELRPLRSTAIHVIDALLKDGYSDYRLQKLRTALTGAIAPSNDNSTACSSPLVQLVSDVCTSRLCQVEIPTNHSPFLQNVLKNINQCREEGNQAQEAITDLIKTGVNFKSLSIGVTIGIAPEFFTRDITSRTVLPLAIIFAACDWEFDDMSALNDEAIRIILESSTQDSCTVHNQTSCFLNVLNGQSVENLKIRDTLVNLWLGGQLIMQQRWDEALWLCDRLSEFDSFWFRQSAKLHMSIFIAKGELKNALEQMTQWLLRGPYYAYEFPVAKIFINRSWSSFSDIDPVLIGFVAHHAYIATEDQDIHYICKKSCRALAMKGGRTYVAKQFEETTNKDEHVRLIAFMRDVWIEANFAFIADIQKTEDARNEQMQVMQLLLEWDEANAADYVDAIKELTLDQTLRNGLRLIDQTRVFVNEVALYRWAEKELYQDYERWLKLSESLSNATLVDDLTRQYLVAPDDLNLLQALSSEPTESDALLIKFIERLFERFLNDPNEGLDCYLSLRIRHGSLRGTLFGELETHRLLYSTTEFSRTEFDRNWRERLGLSKQNHDSVVEAFDQFTIALKEISDELINERIQVVSDKKLKGMIPVKIDPQTVRLFALSLSERKNSFQSLICTGLFIFWKFLEPYLLRLGSYVRTEVKTLVQAEFDSLSTKLREISPQTQPLITSLCTVATTTQSQCDLIGDWFKPPQISGEDNYLLSVAIEIAKEATTNVYRAFPVDINLCSMPEPDLSLAPSGLSVVTDFLFVIFENAWKHSGLKTNIGTIDLYASFDRENNLLTLKVLSNLSQQEITSLKANKLEALKTKYLSQNHAELTRCEGGSGFAKLARLTRFVKREQILQPLEFDIVEQQWMVRITIPLYEREGLYEAYE